MVRKLETPEDLQAAFGELEAKIQAGDGKRAALQEQLVQVEARNVTLTEQLALAKASTSDDASDTELRHYLSPDPDFRERATGAFISTDAGDLQLYGAGVEGHGYRGGLLDDAPRTDWQAELQDMVQTRSIVRTLMAGQKRANVSAMATPQCDRAIAHHLRVAPKEMRIFTQAVANAGAEWIPDSYLPTLVRALELTPRASAMFTARNFPAADALHLPYLQGNIRPYQRAIPTTDDPSNDPLGQWDTDEHLIRMVSHVAGYQIDRDSSEDSLIAVVPIAQERLIRAFLLGEADCIWNGDTAGSQDALATWNFRGLWGTGTSALDHRRAFDGIRKRAIARAALDYAALPAGKQGTTKEVLELVKQLDIVVSADDDSLVIVTSPEGWFRMLEYTDLDGNSAHQIGPQVSGVIGSGGGGLPNQRGMLYGRYPVVVDPMIPADLNADGVYDGVTDDKTVIMAVSRRRYDRWIRKGAMVESDIEIRNNTATLVARHRSTFDEQVPASVGEKNVAILYNVPTT